MEELTLNVNWLAVVVGAVASFITGALWFSSKLFGDKWAEGVALSADGFSGMPVMATLAQAAGTFLLAWIVGVTAASNHLLTIILVLVTIIVLKIAGGLFRHNSAYAIRTETGFIFVMGVIMIVAQGIF